MGGARLSDGHSFSIHSHTVRPPKSERDIGAHLHTYMQRLEAAFHRSGSQGRPGSHRPCNALEVLYLISSPPKGNWAWSRL
jgi:hypothetical protein